jgi:hypothetical protein
VNEDENVFPMDVYQDEVAPRPWEFRPEGYLVVMLADADMAEGAEGALVASGFASRDIKRYTGKQILATYEAYAERQGASGKFASWVADDKVGRELYLGYAREGRCALWLRLPDEDRAPKALRALADFNYLHARYYGDGTQHDFHIS